jgi:hypothetical protein
MGRSGRGAWLRPPLVAFAVGLAVLAVLAPGSGLANGAPLVAALGHDARPMAASVLTASATWNGQSISSASSPGSAFSLEKGQTATVNYSYGGLAGGQVQNATLELTYLGIVLTTSRSGTHVVGGPPIAGAAQINWSFGPLFDALEGVFQLTATLLYANGTTAWSESFYVFAKAPYLLESGAVVVLLILSIAELYWGIASIRDARRGRKPATPSSPPSGGSPPATAPPPPATPAPGTPPPAPTEPAPAASSPAPPGPDDTGGSGGAT